MFEFHFKVTAWGLLLIAAVALAVVALVFYMPLPTTV